MTTCDTDIPMTRRIQKAPTYVPGSSPPPPRSGATIRASADVWAACRDVSGASQEHFVVIDVDARHRVIGRRVVFIGTSCGVEVHPREIFRGALASNAAAVILAHNHPSGDPTPSAQDVSMTTRLRECGDLLGVPVLDHVVVANDGWVSLLERSWK
jgi:DNA repair protein RadC